MGQDSVKKRHGQNRFSLSPHLPTLMNPSHWPLQNMRRHCYWYFTVKSDIGLPATPKQTESSKDQTEILIFKKFLLFSVS